MLDKSGHRCYNKDIKEKEIRKMINYHSFEINNNIYDVCCQIKQGKISREYILDIVVFTLYKFDNITNTSYKISEQEECIDISKDIILARFRRWLTKALEKDLKNA